ncbi:Pc13g02000 [Penicillium rubens Wisconsin 54-1255]|uniref:Pc13g02000 protein n=1 Tax=Penicillium rubens (strain ATCC 28089 / DSM 1075 / NRRL 1951 / Wisconsin 54-1255) TaxID=500485 RepID=B6H1C0_PENRW|nr:Pc13g02000 [Penicillium rubens Wisconsin 54-1255]
MPQTKTVKPARKHVTTACIPCRDGKCDGSKPSCKNCESKNKDCTYRQRNDKRKIPVRVAVSLLASRVAVLSQHIQNAGFGVPAMDKNDRDTLRGILQSLGIACENVLSDENTSHSAGASFPGSQRPVDTTRFVAHDQTNITSPQPPAPGCDNYHPGGDLPPLHERSAGPSQLSESYRMHVVTPTQFPPNVDVIPSENPETDSEDEVTDQFACRLGRVQLTHDGQLRYFGSTSNLNLLDVSDDIRNFTSSLFQKDAQDTLEDLGLNIEVEEAFEKHLLQLYFAWQDPCLHVVDSEAFWKAKNQNRYEGLTSAYYSQALCDAMCAMGAAYEPKYHPDLVTFPRSLSQFFGDRAKALLELEIENPSLATIQALVICSNYEASGTRDTRGWLYSGMAMRLAFDQGLHLDVTPYVEKGIITAEECKIRRTVFWSSSLNDQFWGYYLGRSVRSPVAGVSVRKPCWNDRSPMSQQAPRWRSYGCSQVNIQGIANPSDMIFQQWIALYDLMSPVTDVLYGCLEISRTALQELTADTVARLLAWKNNLPNDLNVDATKESYYYLPHVLTLHLQYYQFMIHCHRPYISKNHIQPRPLQGPGPGHARRMCLESAISIVKVLNMYERRYSFRKANVQMVSYVFSAALILMFVTVPGQSSTQHSDLVRYLSTCFWALDEMGTCFENAKRTSRFLSTLQQQWHKRKRGMAQKGAKRGPENENSPGKHPKRSRNTAGTQNWLGDNLCSSAELGVPVAVDSPISHETHDLSFFGDNGPDLVEFMDPELCNILLSDGIPRAMN